jgi:hypothetical protein
MVYNPNFKTGSYYVGKIITRFIGGGSVHCSQNPDPRPYPDPDK